jgi:endonuclease/exonuclease/phosphatase family metal-dependent hydrolase
MNATYCASIPFQGGKYGIGILSKTKPISARRIPLPGSEEKRSCLMVEFDDYVFGCTHFSLTEADRLTSVEIIRQAAVGIDKPLLLAGDMNASPSSSVMTLFAKDWQILNDIRQFTIPSNAPNSTIDYIMGYTSGGFGYLVSQTRVLTGCLASDHLPVVTDIQEIRLK